MMIEQDFDFEIFHRVIHGFVRFGINYAVYSFCRI